MSNGSSLRGRFHQNFRDELTNLWPERPVLSGYPWLWDWTFYHLLKFWKSARCLASGQQLSVTRNPQTSHWGSGSSGHESRCGSIPGSVWSTVSEPPLVSAIRFESILRLKRQTGFSLFKLTLFLKKCFLQATRVSVLAGATYIVHWQIANKANNVSLTRLMMFC